jgi:hypothetical protein
MIFLSFLAGRLFRGAEDREVESGQPFRICTRLFRQRSRLERSPHFHQRVTPMTDIVALIVGIEIFARKGWDVPGPCRKALEVTQYLIDNVMKSQYLCLYQREVDEGSASTIELRFMQLAQAGVTRGPPTQEAIHSRFRLRL